jgi:heat shock protein HtpX
MFQGGFSWRSRGRSDSSSSSDRGKGGVFIAMIIAVALIAIAWLLSIVIRFALSRSREYLADAGSVELTKNPDAMISALRKIEGRGELEGATSAVMEMCVDNPRQGFADLFATHPPIESRIEAIIKFAGGRDPGPIAIPDWTGRVAEEGQDDSALDSQPVPETQPPSGPSSADPRQGGGKSFLPQTPPIVLGGSSQPDTDSGPWGPHRRS